MAQTIHRPFRSQYRYRRYHISNNLGTEPDDGKTGVLVESFVNATFSEAMDPATINGPSFLLRDITQDNLTVAVNGEVTLSEDGRRAMFEPD